MIDAELPLQAVLRFLLAGELEHERVHFQLDALHVLARVGGAARRDEPWIADLDLVQEALELGGWTAQLAAH